MSIHQAVGGTAGSLVELVTGQCQQMTGVVGNHERDWPDSGDRFLEENAMDSGGECGVVAEKRIPMPIPHPGQQ